MANIETDRSPHAERPQLDIPTLIDQQAKLAEEYDPHVLKGKLRDALNEMPYLTRPQRKGINEALTVAEHAHKHHRRKLSQAPYITHPLIVTLGVIEIGGKDTVSPDTIKATLLHDTWEDNPAEVNEEKLRDQFGEDVAYIVKAVTHTRNGRTLDKATEYYPGIKQADQERPELYIAELKTADRLNNLLDTRIVPVNRKWIPTQQKQQQARDIFESAVRDTEQSLIPNALSHRPDLQAILIEGIERARHALQRDETIVFQNSSNSIVEK